MLRAQDAQEQPTGVLADLHQCCAAGGTVAAAWFVDRGHPLQLRRQGALLRRGAWRLGCRCDALGLRRFHCRLYGGNVLSHRFIKQPALYRIHALGLGGELHPAQPLQLVGQLADQRIALTQRALVRGNRCIALGKAGVALGDTVALLAHHLAQHVDVSNRFKCASIHAPILAV